jgi:hypothetical protein
MIDGFGDTRGKEPVGAASAARQAGGFSRQSGSCGMMDGFCAPEGAPTVEAAFYNRKTCGPPREGAVGATNPLREQLPGR